MFNQLSRLLADRFNYYFVLTIGGLVLLLILLTIVSIGTAPHVRQVRINDGELELKSVTAPKLFIEFSHPMDRDSVESALQISPEVAYDTSWSLNTLQVKLKYNLVSGVDYQLTISPAATDIFGAPLVEEYRYGLTAPVASFTYLERNLREYLPDRIISYSLGSRSMSVLYESDKITNFAHNSKFLVVVVGGDTGSKMRVINLESNSMYVVDLGTKQLEIEKVVMSPVTDQVAFTAQEIEMVNGIPVPKTGDYIYTYHIRSNKLSQLPPDNVLDMIYAPDGGSILFRGDDALYYLINLSDPEEYVELGRHFATGGFNRSREQIVFIDYDPINLGSPYPFLNVYDKDRQSLTLTAGENFVVDPEFFHNSNQLVISEKYQELEGTRGLFGVVIVNEDGSKQSMLTIPGSSLELPRVSLDDRYLIIEKYTPDLLLDYQDMRNYVFQTKPYQGSLVIYDLQQQQFLDMELRGVEAEWR